LNKISTLLKKDYQKKIDECGRDEFLKSRVHDWLMDNSEKIIKEVRDNNQTLLENALRNKNVSKKLNAFKWAYLANKDSFAYNIIITQSLKHYY